MTSLSLTLHGSKLQLAEVDSFYHPPIKLNDNVNYVMGVVFIFSTKKLKRLENTPTLLRIHCNVITGSYTNDTPNHVIHEFPLEKSDILNVPANILYLPVNTTTIKEIKVKITDQSNNVLSFVEDSDLFIRLHLIEEQWDSLSKSVSHRSSSANHIKSLHYH